MVTACSRVAVRVRARDGARRQAEKGLGKAIRAADQWAVWGVDWPSATRSCFSVILARASAAASRTRLFSSFMARRRISWADGSAIWPSAQATEARTRDSFSLRMRAVFVNWPGGNRHALAVIGDGVVVGTDGGFERFDRARLGDLAQRHGGLRAKARVLGLQSALDQGVHGGRIANIAEGLGGD